MKVRYKKRNFFFPLMLIISIILSGLCFASYNSGTSGILAKGLGIVTSPLQAGAENVSNFVKGLGNRYYTVKSLTEENRALKEQNKALKKENDHAKIIKKQNDDLYEFLELKREHTDFKFVNAKIISRTSSNYTSSFTIDKGSFHGLTKDMPIISSDGSLIGVVLSVNTTSAKCLAITSYDMTVGVYDETSGNTGLLSGDFDLFSEKKCLISGLLTETGVTKGDKILTSGLGDIYPAGLIVGTVEDIIPDPDSYTLKAVVSPDTSLLDTDNVMAITSFDKRYE